MSPAFPPVPPRGNSAHMRTLLAVLLLAASVAHAECPGDANGDGTVTVDEIVRAVDSGLNGCVGSGPLDRLAGTAWHLIYADSRYFSEYEFDAEPRVIGSTLRLAGSNVTRNRRVGLEVTESGSVILTEVSGATCVLTELRQSGDTLAGFALAYAPDCTRLIDSTATAVYGTAIR